MPTNTTAQLPAPKSWQEFQEMSAGLFAKEWGDPNATENGRTGQRQNGVDVYGQRGTDWCGVQCKGRRRWPPKSLSIADLNREVAEARKFDPPLKEFTVVTTLDDDAKLQTRARQLTDEHRPLGLFSVHFMGWGEFERRFARHEDLLEKFYAFAGFGQERRIKDHVSAKQEDVKSHVTSAIAPVIEFIQEQAAKEALLQGNDAPVTRGDMQKMHELLESVLANKTQNALRTTMPSDTLSSDKRSEDIALHERIDVIRDLMEDGEPHAARKRLLEIVTTGRSEGKPYAQFRIQSNLASIHLFLGEINEAITGYEAAYQLRPDEPHAKANLALARMFQERFDESMELAWKALEGPEPVEAAVGYLLQAASRSDWTGDPESLIPEAFKGGRHADLGMADFLRRRERPGWEEACLELAARHPGSVEFLPVEAVAALSLAINTGDTVNGGIGPISFERLNQVADRMQAFVQRMLRLGFADEHDRNAHLNNACVLLRVCDRYAEVEDLLRLAGSLADADPNIRRLRALALVQNDKLDEAISYLADDKDLENSIFYSDLVGSRDPEKGLELLLAIDEKLLDDRLKRIRWHIFAQLALVAGAKAHLELAAASLRLLSPGDPEAAIIDALSADLSGASEDEVKAKLIAAASLVDTTSSMHARVFVAEQLRLHGLPHEASTLLDDSVSLDKLSMASQLYLTSLAEARRDAKFRTTLLATTQAVREDSYILWLTAQHSWNVGDLDAAETAIDALVKRLPEKLRLHLFKIGLLARLGRENEVQLALEATLEDRSERTHQDLLRLIDLLGHHGFLMRAGRLAYRVFLERQNDPAAWAAIFRLVLDNAQHPKTSLWDCTTVSDDAAVDLCYDDGDVDFIIVEPDSQLCGKSAESREPEHPLVQSIWGLTKGARFATPSGRTGVVKDLRHKVIAQLHRVLRDFGDRFPGIYVFQKLDVDPAEPHGLDDLKDFLQRQHASSKNATATYARGECSIGMLAMAFRTDQIDAAAIAASNEGFIKVALGVEVERDAALLTIRRYRGEGATLDLLSFWTAWCIGATDVLKKAFGHIQVPRSVYDEMLNRLYDARRYLYEGRRSAGYRGSEIQMTEYSPEYVRSEVDHIERAILWLKDNAEICPVILEDNAPTALQEMYRSNHCSMMDALLVSMQSGTMFFSEDLWMRGLSAALGNRRTACLHATLKFADTQSIIDRPSYVKMTAALIDFGQSYIGVTANDLIEALLLALPGKAPGRAFEQLIRSLGGKAADIASHIGVAHSFFTMLWSHAELLDKEKAATSMVMWQLLRGRHDDYGVVLRAILRRSMGNRRLFSFLIYWAKGHFFPPNEITGEKTTVQRSSAGEKRKKARR